MATIVNHKDVLLQATNPRIIPMSLLSTTLIGGILAQAVADSTAYVDSLTADGEISATEKQVIRNAWDDFIDEGSTLLYDAAKHNIITEASDYVAAFEALSTYLNAAVAWTVADLPTIPLFINDTNVLTNTVLPIGEELNFFRDLLATTLANRKILREAIATATALVTENLRAVGAATNDPVPTGISSVGVNSNGSWDVTLTWAAYIQGTIVADQLVLYAYAEPTLDILVNDTVLFDFEDTLAPANPATSYSIYGTTPTFETSGKFGKSAIFGGGSAIEITPMPFVIDVSEDFTLDFWMKIDALPVAWPYEVVVCNFYNISIVVLASGNIEFQGTQFGVVSAATWHFVRITRISDTLDMSLDGVVGSSNTNGNSYAVSKLIVGTINTGDPGTWDSYSYVGQLDNFRILKGAGISLGNFTVPTAPSTVYVPSPDFRAVTVQDTSIVLSVDSTSYVFRGVSPELFYRAGIAAIRNSSTGVIVGNIIQPTAAPDWRVSAGTSLIGGVAVTTLATAGSYVDNLTSDGVITVEEKRKIRTDLEDLNDSRLALAIKATTFSVTTEKTDFESDFEELGTYLNGGTAWVIADLPTLPIFIDDTNILTETVLGVSEELPVFRALVVDVAASKYAYEVALANAEATQIASTATLTGAGTPVGVVTPLSVGQTYIDTNGPTIYTSYGLLNTEWV